MLNCSMGSPVRNQDADTRPFAKTACHATQTGPCASFIVKHGSQRPGREGMDVMALLFLQIRALGAS